MKAKQFILGTLILGFGLFSCEKKNTSPESNQISMHLIGQDNLYGGSSEGFIEENYVINDSITWNALKAQMDSKNDVTYRFNEQHVDFSQWTVLVSIDEIKMSGGHAINYTNIVENNNNIAVTIDKSFPGGNATTVITQPYIVVKIDKTNKQVIFN
ncbi:protease complex subunit PrcB family protein [Brumimicrobium mesophilum]|uniref:protease complex subunit PrcB family protein n=1 Tax=Brumimicrobium mesophilum TaxID=392717 RepID=UPI000D143AFC|nr:protease complex subunit PrcB family protein [Brumimicrobium mesophilum]